MRIAFINYLWDPDLATPESVLDRFFTLTDWSDAVKAAGASSVVTYQRYRSSAALERHGVRYEIRADTGPPAPSLWSAGAETLHAEVARSPVDLVHVNGVFHPRRVRHLRSMLPPTTALVVQDHGGFEPDKASALKRLWIRRGLAAADALLVSSPGQVDQWRRSGVAPRGLSLFDVMESSTAMSAMPRDEARRQSGVGGSPAILWVGRLNANKDPLTVLRGAATFFNRNPAAQLTMVYAAAELESQVRQMIATVPALANRVRLVGRMPRSEMPAYFSSADLFVLGSHREGSGYAAIEALACGALPVLTDIASFRALTADGTVGVLWQPGNPEALAQALERAAKSACDRQRRECRDFFERTFSWRAIGERAMRIYVDVCRNRASSAAI